MIRLIGYGGKYKNHSRRQCDTRKRDLHEEFQQTQYFNELEHIPVTTYGLKLLAAQVVSAQAILNTAGYSVCNRKPQLKNRGAGPAGGRAGRGNILRIEAKLARGK